MDEVCDIEPLEGRDGHGCGEGLCACGGGEEEEEEGEHGGSRSSSVRSERAGACEDSGDDDEQPSLANFLIWIRIQADADADDAGRCGPKSHYKNLFIFLGLFQLGWSPFSYHHVIINHQCCPRP